MCYVYTPVIAPSFFFAFDYFDYDFSPKMVITTQRETGNVFFKFIKDKDLNFNELLLHG